jgi:hypothetical protein
VNSLSTRKLSKSLFKLGCECPSKLFFYGKDEYLSLKKENDFLDSLAEGGYQVGALAKTYFQKSRPGLCFEIFETDPQLAMQETDQKLAQADITLFESAVSHKNFFARIDILNKVNGTFQLIEVKSKAFDSKSGPHFWRKKVRALTAEWEPYLRDIAFQFFILQQKYPNTPIEPYLYLPDTSCVASVDGLNQKFRFPQNPATLSEVVAGDLGESVLSLVPVRAEIDFLLNEWRYLDSGFVALAEKLSEFYLKDHFFKAGVGGKCKKCEYRVSSSQLELHQKSGFEKCWKTMASLGAQDFEKPFIFDLWNFRETDTFIQKGTFFLEDLTEQDLEKPVTEIAKGLSQSQRQILQLSRFKTEDRSEYFDQDGFVRELETWSFPLHFIDFETTNVAIPFSRGRSPFETIAFQFSHHTVEKDGTSRHQSEYIHLETGVFPNFYFVRELMKGLSQDQGTIFCYSMHENSVLLAIYDQILRSQVEDKKELADWIKTITIRLGKGGWKGPRAFVDQCDLVKMFYYSPYTKGSNSIKKVLPAVLRHSASLQEKYSKPIYGNPNYFKSLNFKNWAWVQYDENKKIREPYDLLGDKVIHEGGAAMLAYAKAQFTDISAVEKSEIKTQLLRYCELDTLAMVLLNEHWFNLLSRNP